MAHTFKPTSSLLRTAALLAMSQGALLPAVHAQTTPAAPAANAAGAEQVVVTARRRVELLQDVPGSVSAITGAEIERAGMPDITALTNVIPSTTLKNSRATNSTLTAFIRGIGQQDPVAGYEQGVGIYLDDVYLARPQGALADIYDLERIEVLRGPQGTLYGRNTIGGAVKYVTRKLGPKTELNLKATLGNYGQRDVVGRASTPVNEVFRIGASVASFNRDGFGKNVVNGAENYNKEVLAGRVTAELTPTSNLFVRLAADRTVDDSLPRQGYRLTPGPAPANDAVLPGKYDTRANLYTALGHAQQVITHGESLLIDYMIDATLSFKSITATRGSKSYAPIDFDSLNTALFEAPSIYTDKQTSQEFQLSYNTPKLKGVAGLFFMRANAFNEFDVLYNAAGGLSLYTKDDIDTRTWALYADGSYSLSDSVNIDFGGRYTSDQRKAQIFKATYLGLAGSPTLGNPAAVGLTPNTNLGKSDLQRTDTKFTPKIGFGWKFAPQHNLYGSYAAGFKGGFFDPRMDLGGNPTSTTSLEKRKGVKPEEADTYELGLKSTFDKGRVQTNAAVFYTNYTNVQIPGSTPTYDAAGNVTGFAGNVTNAGKAKIQGLELEALARVTDAFSVSGMVSFIDAKYKEWIVANGLTGASAALVNVAQFAEFQNTPKRSASLTATYDWPLAVLGKAGTLSLGNTLSYKSLVYQGEFVHPSGVPALDATVGQLQSIAQPAYSLWDASLVWTSADRKLQVSLIGRNLSDKRYIVAGYPFGAFFNTVTAFYGDPRTVKATVNWKY